LNETTINTKYVFDNEGSDAINRYLELSRLYDGQTTRHIEELGIKEGWSCLEVGGGGSIAAWLCNRVGDTGRVIATDINPGFLHSLSFPNLEVVRHDIRTEPLPTHEFDFVHARLVLTHFPERNSILERMVAALKPGGWILIDEFEDSTFLPEPAVYPGEVSLKLIRAFQEVLTSRGVDLRYGRLLPQQFYELGLTNIGGEASATIWKAGSAGARIMKLNFEEMRESFIDSGRISQSEFDAEMEAIDRPDFLMPSPMMWSVWGQRMPLFTPQEQGR
jgi:ubiquinone/menaquinone biosynthesis C-methylase UbiE